MLLIPEQIRFLRNSIHNLEDELKEYSNYFETMEYEKLEINNKTQPLDHIISDGYNYKLQQLKEYRQLLMQSSYVRKVPTNQIGIGTRFKVCFDDLGVCQFILIDSMIGNHLSDESVTLSSILGQNVIGKKVGDSFSYRVDSYNEIVSGTIEEIYKENNQEIGFIRTRKADHRKCEMVTKEIDSYIEKIGERVAASIEYDRQIPITQSQVLLLQEELERLIYFQNFNIEDSIEKRKLGRRIGRIKNILANREIALPIVEDVIEIGSVFSIMLFEKDHTIIKRVELIGKAYSDELNDEYIEKISPLGSSVYGLHNNDEFVYRTGPHFITGIVYDIDNSKGPRVLDALEYQKKMQKKIS